MWSHPYLGSLCCQRRGGGNRLRFRRRRHRGSGLACPGSMVLERFGDVAEVQPDDERCHVGSREVSHGQGVWIGEVWKHSGVQ